MTEALSLPYLVEALIGALLVGGAAITLVGSAGLLRLGTFYERAHAPTLGTTLGTTLVSLASMIHFSSSGTQISVREMLIVALVTLTTPISLIVITRASVFRDEYAKAKSSPQRTDDLAG